LWDIARGQNPHVVEFSMSASPLLAACGVAILSLALPLGPAFGADRRSGEGQLLFWLLGLKTAQEPERQSVDVNSATVEELRAVPGIDRHQALRIIAERPYAKVQDLARADLSPGTIERVARFLVAGPDWPSALPGPAGAPRSR
jgi:hypothetical protein